MSGVQFGNVGGNVEVGTMAGRDIIQGSTLAPEDKRTLEGLSRQLETTVDEKKDGWQAKAETLLTHMVSIGKDIAIKVAVGILTKRIVG